MKSSPMSSLSFPKVTPFEDQISDSPLEPNLGPKFAADQIGKSTDSFLGKRSTSAVTVTSSDREKKVEKNENGKTLPRNQRNPRNRSFQLQNTFENHENQILENKIVCQLDLTSDNFEYDLVQNHRKSTRAYKLHTRLVQLYPYNKPFSLSEEDKLDYLWFIGLKAERGNLESFLGQIPSNLKKEASNRGEKLKKKQEQFELVLGWVLKRYERYNSIFCYTSEAAERVFLKKLIRLDKAKEEMLAQPAKELELFANEEGILVRKSLKGRMVIYTQIGSIGQD